MVLPLMFLSSLGCYAITKIVIKCSDSTHSMEDKDWSIYLGKNTADILPEQKV